MAGQDVADWLMSAEGEDWSSAEHDHVAGVISEMHRLGAWAATVEPAEHPDECGPGCHQIAKAFYWQALVDPGEAVTSTAGWVTYEPGLCDPRLGSPA
jgi:hypothetical protein